MNPGDRDRPGLPPWRHVGAVLLVCLLVFWPRLGATGFSATEGHRVIPGWEMLQSGEYLVPRMFGQVYLRKPPGMPWAVAGMGAIFGQSEWSARAVSALAATAMALVALVFGSRWFGRRSGIAAGLATALTPLFWPDARSAEIEALNNLGTMAAVLLIADLLVVREGGRAVEKAALAVLAAAAMVVAGLAKGPAGFTAIGCAAAAGLIVGGRGAVRRSPWLGASVLMAGGVLGAAGVLVWRAAAATGQEPVVQGVSEFLWTGRALTAGGIAAVLLMAPTALLSALPATLGLLLPWGPDARREVADGLMPGPARAAARALGLACLLSLLLLTALGVANPRYASPSLSFVPVLAAYGLRGLAGGFEPVRREIARWLWLGRPAVWAALLLIAAVVYIGIIEPRKRASSGRDAGLEMAGLLPAGAVVWADHMVEARPETLLYAARASGARAVWVPGMARMGALPRHGFLVLRADEASGEAQAYSVAGLLERMPERGRWRVHKFECVLVEKPE